MIGEGGRGVSGWCMQLATWLERTRRNAPSGARQERQKRTVALCAGPGSCTVCRPSWPTQHSDPLVGRLGPAGVSKEIGAHDSTATLNSCRWFLALLHPQSPQHMTMTAVAHSPSGVKSQRLEIRTNASPSNHNVAWHGITHVCDAMRCDAMLLPPSSSPGTVDTHAHQGNTVPPTPTMPLSALEPEMASRSRGMRRKEESA